MVKRVVAINERGIRIGEDHPRAKLTNHEVDLILALRDGGASLRQIAARFEITYGAVWYICTGRRRCQTPAGWKAIRT